MVAAVSISIVTYDPDLAVLRRTVDSLLRSIRHARTTGRLGHAAVYLVDNGPGAVWEQKLQSLAGAEGTGWAPIVVLSGHGNPGYGAGHNLVMLRTEMDFHLVLNPDVVLEEDALARALEYMEGHAEAAMLVPQVRDPAGQVQMLCKRYPSVLVLLLRAFAPAWVQSMFRRRLDVYEMRDRVGAGDAPVPDIPLASGSFMFCRCSSLRRVPGFDEGFFMYFEDFDLSMRLQSFGNITYVPAVRIVHSGGGASRKGWRHVLYFARSAGRFFRRHGLRWT